MPKLIIVESPTKARTISRFLGNGFRIISSYGHIRDLPKSKIGVDLEKNFEPVYEIPKDKEQRVKEIKSEAKGASEIILATDPDREGEAIAWHLNHILGGTKNAKRIVFHEITEDAIKEAMEHARTIDFNLVDAQQARRVLDRIVGYKLSPLLWKKVKIGLSAGRVQSVAVRLIAEREEDILKFKPQEYWDLNALFAKIGGSAQSFLAFLFARDGIRLTIKGAEEEKKEGEDANSKAKPVKEVFNITTKEEAEKVLLDLKTAEYTVVKVDKKEVKKNPYPPFTTSTMNQAAANKFGFAAKRTMKLAQDLYEEGLITYHRTDSVNIAAAAVSQVRGYISGTFGNQYVAPYVRNFRSKSKNAQEAHEAIRPAKVNVSPEQVKIGKDHQKLYNLIWQRFVACQMAEAIYDRTSVDINTNTTPVYTFRANGSTLKFAGWLKVYGLDEYEPTTDDQGQQTGAEDDLERILPELTEGEKVDLKELKPEQKFTQPPPRYTEASLIKKLEELGIGRPSTYAPTISTIQDRKYVEKEQRNFRPTPLGTAVTEFLVKNFPEEMDYNFTATLEDELDNIAEGTSKWQAVMKDFYGPFNSHLEVVERDAERVKVVAETVDDTCDEGHQLVVRYGPFGKFLACEKYPEHKFTKPFATEEMIEKEEEIEKLDWKCPQSGDDMVVKRTRRGRVFYGCSGYPKCKYASWTKPGDEGFEEEQQKRADGTYGSDKTKKKTTRKKKPSSRTKRSVKAKSKKKSA